MKEIAFIASFKLNFHEWQVYILTSQYASEAEISKYYKLLVENW